MSHQSWGGIAEMVICHRRDGEESLGVGEGY